MVKWTLILPPSVVVDAARQGDPELTCPIPRVGGTHHQSLCTQFDHVLPQYYNVISYPGRMSDDSSIQHISTQQQLQHFDPDNGRPYLSNMALVDSVPTPSIDNLISAVMALFFLIATATHMAVLQYWSYAWPGPATRQMCGWPLQAISSKSPELCWYSPLICYSLGNYPNFRWNKPVGIFSKFQFTSVVVSLLMTIAATVQPLFTLDADTREHDRKVQLFGAVRFRKRSVVPNGAKGPGSYMNIGNSSESSRLRMVLEAAGMALSMRSKYPDGSPPSPPPPLPLRPTVEIEGLERSAGTAADGNKTSGDY
ncbi:hypothetical protein BKA67DRAFT_533794 [Truncatella angustata]|uniref:Uncharacterized protein n=1 Tax=Truncatella angustata TaxID=152316 RepID=A0A9P9A2X6_9PEZI|nr:uncharacterized protein BKA67DRAFT_533794 [Truncatella angustata]KAH6658671.1 hypothetical protein BKA67DRAFT_533794 [Truncatella angustata]